MHVLDFIEAPLGGVPPPKVFGVRRVAIRKGVWKNQAWKDLSFPEGVRTDFLLGFVLGRFLDSRLCPRQVLGFSWQSWLKTWPRTTKTKSRAGGSGGA